MAETKPAAPKDPFTVEKMPGPPITKPQDLHSPIAKPGETPKYDPSKEGAVNKRSHLEPGHTDPNTGETAPAPGLPESDEDKAAKKLAEHNKAEKK